MDDIQELIRPKFSIESRFCAGGEIPLEVTSLDWGATSRPLPSVEALVCEDWGSYGNPHSCGTVTAGAARNIIEGVKKIVREHTLSRYDYEVEFGGDGSSYWLDRIPELFTPDRYSVVCFQREVHNSLVQPWISRGWEVAFPTGDKPGKWYERKLRYILEIEKKTPIILASLASHVTGGVLHREWITDVEDAVLILDATCYITHHKKLPDVRFDFAVFSGHKLPGGPGSPGVVIHAPKHSLRPQPGTPNVTGISRLGHSLKLRTRLLSRHSRPDLVKRLDEFLRGEDGWMEGFKVHMWDPEDMYEPVRHPIYSFSILWNSLYIHPDIISDMLLNIHGLQIRVGGQCADYTLPSSPQTPDVWLETQTMDPVLRPSVCRISINSYLLTEELVERIERALRAVISFGYEAVKCYTISDGKWAMNPSFITLARSARVEIKESSKGCSGCSGLDNIISEPSKEKREELDEAEVSGLILSFEPPPQTDKFHLHPYRWFLHPMDVIGE
jgi:selenocysteine lyase/cysteine desulfurase